jgi:uncharacterized membrane protein YoaK (UPF0700 family)
VSPVNRVPIVQSLIAGMVEVLGFLMLGGLFTAHVTGNLVVLAALLVQGASPTAPQVLAVPTYVVALIVVWVIARSLNMRGPALVRPLLLMELLLLGGVLLLAITSDIDSNPNAGPAGLAAIFATSAIACQFAMMRLAVPGAPSTAVMTGNLTNSVLSALDMFGGGRPLLQPDPDRLRKTSIIFVAFCSGGVAGALAYLLLRDWSWTLPVTLSGVTLGVELRACTRRPALAVSTDSREVPDGHV